MSKTVKIGNIKIGEGFVIIAGPCSVESEEQICRTAEAVKAGGASLLRGGAFKARTSPYSFQGLGEDGIRMLVSAKEKTGLPAVSEITDAAELPLFKDVDMLQIGARNMQNYVLLREIGKSGKPVLLKRGFGCTVEELLSSAEYIRSAGNENIVLCERGIRSFENSTRFTLDISAVSVIKEKSDYPVIVDPSHAAGDAKYIKSLAMAATAAGADGLLLEVHCNPKEALSDSRQALDPESFSALAKACFEIRPIVEKYKDE